MFRRFALVSTMIGAVLASGRALAVEPPLTSQVVATGLTKPLLVTHAPNDFQRIFIVEQNGKIKILKNGSILATHSSKEGPGDPLSSGAPPSEQQRTLDRSIHIKWSVFWGTVA